MSDAWEVTEEDVENVLASHELKVSAKKIFDEIVSDEADRIEDAVLYYDGFEDQVNASYSEIEDILIENKIIKGKKKYRVS